ncbi:putative GDP-mannose transporter [Fragilariopsis cylindrus CCMP1102]|uniref:Putative GDP-mannose transporter n=1 Tax=Fragilariopsis cylindrus CCMP1102 TaxID=635003 RepID=A0A1E7EU37_9STRA|nr:putative GDP-mannose transporter [Fragilariopsis cylindrus CCMP1102]|eukprot:OEU09349.1 putative GDP-mannose transporter [Fragilariopsis cylindrus CCMP1102]
MSDNDSRKSSTGIIASESSSRASSPNTSRGDVDVDDEDNKSIHSEVDYKDVELAPLTPKNKDDNADTAEEEAGLLVDPHKNRNTSEWISFIVKKNGKVLSTCLSYSFCSVSMVLVNKSLASSYNHLIDGDLNILLVVIQAIVAVFAVEGCKRLGWVDYPSFSFETAKEWAPVNIFFCLMLFTGMSSLQYNSVPMVTIFKNVSNITTAVGDYYCFGNKPEPLVVVAFGIMLSGAVAAASNDLSLSPMGILWMIGNCVSASGYVLYMKHATEKVKLSKFGMVFYNNVLCVVFLLPVAIAMGQTTVFFTTPAIHTPDYAMKNLFAGLVGFLLNFASLSCVATSGPTTYVTIGSLNKIPVAILGYYIFDSVISQETWFFIAVSMCGGFLYSYAKLISSSSPRTNRTK